MRYRDVVTYQPIGSVVQLREAAGAEKARELVSSYVISDRMAEQMVEIIFPQLQFEKPVDNRGLLILGNYGTGKSHLMSLLSAVAERPELLDAVTHSRVKNALPRLLVDSPFPELSSERLKEVCATKYSALYKKHSAPGERHTLFRTRRRSRTIRTR